MDSDLENRTSGTVSKARHSWILGGYAAENRGDCVRKYKYKNTYTIPQPIIMPIIPPERTMSQK